MAIRLCALVVLAGIGQGLIGCAADHRVSPELTWRPTFEGRLEQLDDELRAYDDQLAARDPRPDETAWVLEQLALLGARDRLVHERWSQVLAEVPPVQRSFARQRLAKRVHETQVDNAALLEPLLDRYGWFTVSDFGPEADRDAWRVVQHADARPDLQQRVLVLLEGLVEVGETDPAHFAYLADRVAISRGEQQSFGTQGECVAPGTWEPYTILEAETVDERRAQLSLMPLADYVALASEGCP